MTPIYLILIVAGIQIAILQTTKKVRLKFKSLYILVLILIGHLVIFPPLFFPEPTLEGTCAMPAMIILFLFWFIGGGTTLLIHFIYYFIQKNDN